MGERSRRWGKRKQRKLLILLLVGLLLIAGWLGASWAVAWKLTRRAQPRMAEEPVPALHRGQIESLRLTTRDNEEIGAWLMEGASDGPCVLLLHANGGRRGHSLALAEIWTQAGASVLMITLRAHGDSSGQINDFGYSARLDAIAAVEYLERRYPDRPIVLHGTSLGAAAAVFAAGELGDRVAGYVLACPYLDLRTAVRNRTENYLPPLLDLIAYQGLVTAAPLVLPEAEEVSLIDHINAIPTHVPVMILAGERDLHARPEEAVALHAQVADHGQLVMFQEAIHTRLYQSDPDLYRSSVLEWAQPILDTKMK